MWSCQLKPCWLKREGDQQFGIQVLPQGIQTSPIQLFWCLRCCSWHHTTFSGRCFAQFLGAPVHPLKLLLPDPAATLCHWMIYRPCQGRGWTSQKSTSIPHPTVMAPEHPGSLYTCQLCAQALAAWQIQLQVQMSQRLLAQSLSSSCFPDPVPKGPAA